MKKIVESEAIKIYILKDKARKNVWIVESPDSLKNEANKKYTRKKWCFNSGSLMKRIQELTNAKILE